MEIIDDNDMVSMGGIITQKITDALNWNSRKGRYQKYKRFKRQNPTHAKIVSEGDSWFQHPLVFDVIDHLLDWFPIYSLGAGGDTLRNMHTKPGRLLKAINQESPSILLISAGGNDILGDPQFGGFLNEYTPGFKEGENPERFLNEKFF